MAQTRMRKAFRYQDDSDEDEPLAMDEQGTECDVAYFNNAKADGIQNRRNS